MLLGMFTVFQRAVLELPPLFNAWQIHPAAKYNHADARTHSAWQFQYAINHKWFLLEMPFENYKFDFKLKLQKDF